LHIFVYKSTENWYIAAMITTPTDFSVHGVNLAPMTTWSAHKQEQQYVANIRGGDESVFAKVFGDDQLKVEAIAYQICRDINAIGNFEGIHAESKSNRYSETVEIFYGEHQRAFVHVFINKKLSSDQWEPASVNWSALGSVTAEEATKFARALIFAQRVAEQLNKKYNVEVA
jgi:hypothetical protein